MMDKEIYGIIGLVLGAFLKLIFDIIKLKIQHHHEGSQSYDPAEENVKNLLIEMLNHKNHIDRSFNALKGKIGGYSEDEIRRLLMAVGAQQARGKTDGSKGSE
ncbi:hypothetical protein ACVBE9_09785 [Eionea flava]